MITRNTTILLLSTTLFASVAFASNVAEPETPGSAGPQAVAEAIHNARMHGNLGLPVQPVAQAPGSVQPQAVSEDIHRRRLHGSINDSADQRTLKEGNRF